MCCSSRCGMLQWGVFHASGSLEMLYELLHLVMCMWSPCNSNRITVEGAFERKVQCSCMSCALVQQRRWRRTGHLACLQLAWSTHPAAMTTGLTLLASSAAAHTAASVSRVSRSTQPLRRMASSLPCRRLHVNRAQHTADSQKQPASDLLPCYTAELGCRCPGGPRSGADPW
jgi:hypothetical protein